MLPVKYFLAVSTIHHEILPKWTVVIDHNDQPRSVVGIRPTKHSLQFHPREMAVTS